MVRGRRATLFFVVFLFVLVVPFALKTYNSALEIFPGVILPTGSYRHHFENDTLRYTYYLKAIPEVAGNQQPVELNEHDFLGEIPRHYLSFILKNSILPLKDESHEMQDKEREELKNWIRTRLRYNGFRDSILVVEGVEFRLQKGQKNILDKRVKDRYEIHLH